MKKKVLLIIPDLYSLNKLIERELQRMGYNVVTIMQDYCGFSWSEKIEISIRSKIVNLNKNRRKQIIKDSAINIQKRKINKYEHYDICLTMRADLFYDEVLEYAREKSTKIISYHYDGIGRGFETIFSKVHYFDDFYVFDQTDVDKYPEYNFKSTTNFFFNDPISRKVNKSFDYDFYYLAFYDKSRVDVLNKITDFFKENDITYRFDIHCLPDTEDNGGHRNIEKSIKAVPYELYLERMKKSKYVLDILVSSHSGISLRVIESLYYKKKVVTNNSTVKGYDFYCPENIFILDERPMSELKCFLQSDYKELDPAIVEKYSFEHWFNSKIK